MSMQVTLGAEKREEKGKGANRKLRARGRIPAVLYGKDQEATSLSLDAHEAEQLFQKISVENTIIDLKVEGDRSKIQALVREVQVAAVRPDLIHVDFYRIQKGVLLEVEIPVHLSGVPTGVRNDGGVLEQQIHDLPVRCMPDQIPEEIVIDVTGLELQDSLHVSDLAIPEGVEVQLDPERTICVVSPPRVVEETETEGEEAEVEVIGAEGAGEAEEEEEGEEEA